MKYKAAGCLTAIVVVIMIPLMYFASGWLTGWILKVIAGDALVNGLNLLFDTARFTPNMLPLTCAALSVVGSFFKPGVKTSMEKEEE